ncbi:MAG: 4Fe-4S binding protein, partial [Spirochaetales bacterium]|nr:4Fe-4S binding protein [Spirochaetales bacterium]
KCGACIDKCPKGSLSFGGAAPAEEAADDGDLTCADSCVFCGLCAKACPADAIEVDRKAKSWKVDTDECIKCGACIDKCPKGSLSFGGAAAEPAEPAKKSIASVKEGECIGCNACVNQCPEEAIPPVVESEWKLEEEKCIGCGACVDACPVDAISMKEV